MPLRSEVNATSTVFLCNWAVFTVWYHMFPSDSWLCSGQWSNCGQCNGGSSPCFQTKNTLLTQYCLKHNGYIVVRFSDSLGVTQFRTHAPEFRISLWSVSAWVCDCCCVVERLGSVLSVGRLLWCNACLISRLARLMKWWRFRKEVGMGWVAKTRGSSEMKRTTLSGCKWQFWWIT